MVEPLDIESYMLYILPMDIQEVEIEAGQDVKIDTARAEYSKRKGIPIEDMLELRRKDLTLKQISVILGCSEANVHKRLKGFAPVQVKIDRYKRHRADLLTLTQATIHDSITPDVIAEASLLQRTTAMGIMYDKERLERGQSTSNVDIHTDIRNSIERVEAIRALIAKGGGGRGEDGEGDG